MADDQLLDRQPKRPRGRPPVPPEQRKPTKPQRSIRLSDAHWAELQRRGVRSLEQWLDTPET